VSAHFEPAPHLKQNSAQPPENTEKILTGARMRIRNLKISLIPRQELLFVRYTGWRTFYGNPTYPRTEQEVQENDGQKNYPSQRYVWKSLVKDFQRQTLFHKVTLHKEDQKSRPHSLETEYKNGETLKGGKRLVSLQHQTVKPPFIPGTLQRKNILLPQEPSEFHLMAAAFKFPKGIVVIVGRGH
jgi:hypothetical protein